MIGPGCEVLMHFSLTLEEGTVADSTRGGEPMRFVVGDGSLAPGLEAVLHGRRAGEHRSVNLSPEALFGERDPAAVHTMPRADFPDGLEPEEGLVVGFSAPGGQEVDAEGLADWIRNGGGGMPGVPLADDEMEALIVFLEQATQ